MQAIKAQDQQRQQASAASGKAHKPHPNKAKPGSLSTDSSLTPVLAMDCEMVGVGPNGTKSVLARVCIVNSAGNVLLDTFVRPQEKVTDFRCVCVRLSNTRMQFPPDYIAYTTISRIKAADVTLVCDDVMPACCRTWVSGVRPADIVHGRPHDEVVAEVARMVRGRIIVGHALHNDFKVLELIDHPKELVRDTSK